MYFIFRIYIYNISIFFIRHLIKQEYITNKYDLRSFLEKIEYYLEKFNYKIEKIEEDKFIIVKSDELLESVVENDNNKDIKEYLLEYQSNNLQTKNIKERVKEKKNLLFIIYRDKNGLEGTDTLLDKLVNKCDIRHGIDCKEDNKDVEYFRKHYSSEEKEEIYNNIFRYMLYLLDNYNERTKYLEKIRDNFEENRKKIYNPIK